jgi:hypothetical protein
VTVGLLVGVSARPLAAQPIDGEGVEPGADLAEQLRETLCAAPGTDEVCRCAPSDDQSPEIRRVQQGAFSAPRPELLVHLEGCTQGALALFRRPTGESGKKNYTLVDLFEGVDLDTCRAIAAPDRPDLLICHWALDGGTWRFGAFDLIDLREGDLTRRQLTSYHSNARGCPTGRLEARYPVGWRLWQVADDPRPPLLSVFLRDQSGPVPERFDDACRAMEQGEPVFGDLKRLTEYFEWRDGRLVSAGATRRGGEPSEGVEWTSAERPTGEICRPEEFAREVRRRSPAIRDCYRSALADDAELQGQLRLRCRLGRDGGVEAVEFSGDELQQDPLRRCIAGVVEQITLAPPRGGDECTFVYPFDFAPAKSGE